MAQRRGKMLKDEPLEYIEEQFMEKNEVLNALGEWVSAGTLYEDIYGDLEQVLPVVIIDEDEGRNGDGKHIVPMPICDAIEQAETRNDMLLGGSTFFRNWISKKTTKDVLAFIIDMDNVYSGTLQNALRADWKTANGEPVPMPTYIVNSGTGLHLYFVLTEPAPHYAVNAEAIDKIYRALAVKETTKRVYIRQQVQWYGQDFRMAGGLNKYGWVNEAFRVGEKWDVDDLAKAVGLDGIHIVRYGEKRGTKPYAKPKSVKRVQKRIGWLTDRAFYDCALRRCRDETVENWRYTSMCSLSVIAWKCGVEKDELERDLLSLLPDFNKGAQRQVKEREVYSAMRMYNQKAMSTQRESLERWQGWEYHPIPRNGRKRHDHLHTEIFVDANGRKTRNSCRDNRLLNAGRRKGTGEKKEAVMLWRMNNPDGRKIDCHRQTGLSRPTIDKWWDWRPDEGGDVIVKGDGGSK